MATDGLAVGFADALGLTVGIIEGDPVGLSLGTLLGESVGVTVGFPLGTDVGLSVTDNVGATEGIADGKEDGTSVFGVGLAVGRAVVLLAIWSMHSWLLKTVALTACYNSVFVRHVSAHNRSSIASFDILFDSLIF